MKLSQYLNDPDALVKVNGKPLDRETFESFGGDIEMGDCIAFRTVHGLVTVTSKSPYKMARTIRDSRPAGFAPRQYI